MLYGISIDLYATVYEDENEIHRPQNRKNAKLTKPDGGSEFDAHTGRNGLLEVKLRIPNSLRC
jgi:hypothetical protein